MLNQPIILSTSYPQLMNTENEQLENMETKVI